MLADTSSEEGRIAILRIYSIISSGGPSRPLRPGRPGPGRRCGKLGQVVQRVGEMPRAERRELEVLPNGLRHPRPVLAERDLLQRTAASSWRENECSSCGRLCSVVTRRDVVLAQNGPQPLQLGLHPAQFLGQRHAAGSGLGPLLLPASTGSQQLLLLVAQRGREPRNPARRSRLPSPGAPARSPGPGRPGQAAGPPSVRSRPADGPASRPASARRRAEGNPHRSRPRRWGPCSSWTTCWRVRFRSAPSFTSTCAATPLPSRIRPSRMCSVPM